MLLRVNNRRLAPVLKKVNSIVNAECVAFVQQAGSIRDAVGTPVQAVGECVAQADGFNIHFGSSQVIGECVCAPVFSCLQVGESSVVCECIAQVGLGSSGGIDVYDEGVLVKTNIRSMNYTGADVRSQLGAVQDVDVFIPTPSWVSHWNTADGTNNCSVSSISTTNRYIASPSGGEGTPFYSGGAIPWGGDLATHSATRTTPVSWTSSNPCLFDDALTSFVVTISDSTGTIATHSETNISGNLSTSAQNITITIAGWTSVSGGKYQAVITVSVDLATLLPNSGYFDISMVHNSGGTPYTKTQ